MNIPLYARMNEFAPSAAGKGGVEDSHDASPSVSQEASHDGQDQRKDEEESPHGTLIEQCTAPIGKFTGKASEGEATAARGDIAQHSSLTADMPDLRIGSELAEGSLADGYKLHDVALFDSGSFDKKAMAAGVSEFATKDFAQSSLMQSNVVPPLELDFSAAPEEKSA